MKERRRQNSLILWKLSELLNFCVYFVLTSEMNLINVYQFLLFNSAFKISCRKTNDVQVSNVKSEDLGVPNDLMQKSDKVVYSKFDFLVKDEPKVICILYSIIPFVIFLFFCL